MTGISLYYADVYADCKCSAEELCELIARIISGELTGHGDVGSGNFDISVCRNPDIHGSGYNSYPFLIEVEQIGEIVTRESAAKSLSLLLKGLWAADVTTVTEYMFEQDLPLEGRNDGRKW